MHLGTVVFAMSFQIQVKGRMIHMWPQRQGKMDTPGSKNAKLEVPEPVLRGNNDVMWHYTLYVMGSTAVLRYSDVMHPF